MHDRNPPGGIWRGGGLLLGALLLAAAGATHGWAEGRTCTQIGCDSGVLITLGRLPAAARQVDVCVDARCRRMTLREERAAVFVRVRTATHRPVDVRLRILSRSGRRLVGARASTVWLRRLQPNGSTCPPVCFFRRLRLIGGKLVPLG